MRVRATRFTVEGRNRLAPRAYRRQEWKRVYRQSGMSWAQFNPYWEMLTGTKEDAVPQKILVFGGEK